MTKKEKDALENLINAWESLPGGKYYSPADIQTWIVKQIKPNIDTIRTMLSRKIPTE